VPQTPDWTPFLEAGMHFTAMTRSEARRLAQQLVTEGQLAQERAQSFVDEMVDSSKRRADELVDVVRGEFQRQVTALGIATKEDLAELERRLAKAGAKSGAGKAKKSTAKKKKTASKAKKTSAKTKKTGKKKSSRAA
jgi:polyhydroxyalkanoate synthesis regulator phasin